MSIKSFVFAHCPSFLRSTLDRIENSPIGYRLSKGVFWLMAGTFISQGMTLIAMIAVARILGKTVFGELGMIRATVEMLGIFAGFALGLTATKYVAEFRETDPERAGRIIGLSWVVSATLGGGMALGLVFFAPWLAEHTIKAPHLAPVLRVGAVMLFITALNGAQTGALSGLEAFKTIARVNLTVGLTSFPILLLGTYTAGLTGTVWALAANYGILWVLNHIALRKEARRHQVPLRIQGSAEELPVLWNFSLPAVISGTMVSPVFWAAKSILVNEPRGYAALGTIAMAESWRLVPSLLCNMIAQVNLPIMSQLFGQGKMREFRNALTTQFLLNGAIAVLGVIIVSALSTFIISIYGPEFKGGQLVLVLVVASTIPMQLTTVVGTANRCIGKIWWNVIFNGVWGTVYLIATVLLVKYGALGLASAVLIAYTFQLVTATIYVFWRLRSPIPYNALTAESKNPNMTL